jgi:hypothetical protein
MPAGQRDRGLRTGEPQALPHTAMPAQVHDRAEPTAINGYPPTHARGPAGAAVPHAPQTAAQAAPPVRDVPQAGAPVHGGRDLPPAGPADRGFREAPAAGTRGPGVRDLPAAGPAAGVAARSAEAASAPVAIPTSGPDTPRKYADADLGATWFSTKPDSDAAEVKAAGPGPAPAGTTEPISDPPPPSGTGTAGDRSGTAGDGIGVVLNLDLTGLLNGLPADQAIIVPAPAAPGSRTGQAEPAVVPQRAAGQPQAPGSTAGAQTSGPQTVSPGTSADGRAGGTNTSPAGDAARPPLMPGPEPTEPKTPERPLKPLSAADLGAIRWRLDGASLREVVDDRDALRELGVRLDEPLSQDADNVTRSGLLSVRAEVYRLLGELGMAAAASRLALAHAESAGDNQSIVIAQAELAHVLRLRGDFAEADRLFEEAASSESSGLLRSVVHENAGRSCFDQGRHMEALDHFARAIRLGPPEDMDLVERIDVCLEAVYIHVLRDGWGPYPRMRREILGPAPRPAGADPQRRA